MPVIKVRENEPFDVALRPAKKQVFWRKFVVVSSMKNRLPNVSALKLLQ